MAKTTHYSWRVYGPGGLEAPSCKMVAYHDDPAHTPPKWDETLSGDAKAEAIAIVEADRKAAEAIPNGEGYYQGEINGPARWYYRTSKASGNTWEVVLNEAGDSLPNPCLPTSPPPPPDPRNGTIELSYCELKTEIRGRMLTLTLTGLIAEA